MRTASPMMINLIAASVFAIRTMGIATALLEVRKVFKIFRLFQTFLTSLLLFLVMVFAFLLLNMPWWYAALVAGLYFMGKGLWIVMKANFGQVEHEIPELEWQLRTAAESISKENEVVRNLREQVLKNIQQVKTGYFVNTKKTTFKLMGIACLSFLIFVTAFFHLDMDRFGNLASNFKKQTENGITGQAILDLVDGIFEKDSDRNIFGTEDVAELGQDPLSLAITPENSKTDISQTDPLKALAFKKQEGIGDLGAVADASYVEKINKEDQEISKNYLLKIAGIEQGSGS